VQGGSRGDWREPPGRRSGPYTQAVTASSGPGKVLAAGGLSCCPKYLGGRSSSQRPSSVTGERGFPADCRVLHVGARNKAGAATPGGCFFRGGRTLAAGNAEHPPRMLLRPRRSGWRPRAARRARGAHSSGALKKAPTAFIAARREPRTERSDGCCAQPAPRRDVSSHVGALVVLRTALPGAARGMTHAKRRTRGATDVDPVRISAREATESGRRLTRACTEGSPGRTGQTPAPRLGVEPSRLRLGHEALERSDEGCRCSRSVEMPSRSKTSG